MQIGEYVAERGPTFTVKHLKDRLDELDDDLPVIFEHHIDSETTISVRHTIDSVQELHGVFKLISNDD